LLSGRSAPAPEALFDMLDQVADLEGPALARVAARPTSVERAAGHARVLKAILPDQRDRLRRLVDRLGDDAPVRPGMIHGDLHDTQLLVRDCDISGLLDIDGLGPGDRIDDPATLIAYLSALGADVPRAALRIRGYSEGIMGASSRLAEPDDLARRVAATFVGLATSPFRVQQPHWRATTLRLIALAERWAARAERTNGRGSRSRRDAVS
jgi:aminoglycoside phosphotransferase (APT) family kinase protein